MARNAAELKSTTAQAHYTAALAAHNRLLRNAEGLTPAQFLARDRRSAMRVARAYLRLKSSMCGYNQSKHEDELWASFVGGLFYG